MRESIRQEQKLVSITDARSTRCGDCVFFYGGIIGVGQGYRAGGLANRWMGGVVMVASRLASRPVVRSARWAGGGRRLALPGLYSGLAFASLLLAAAVAFPFPLPLLPLFMKFVSRSMGSGNMMVEFFSAEMEFSV